MSNNSQNIQNTDNMSSYSDSIQAYAYGKSRQTAGSASSASAPVPASTYASSTYSDTSYYKDNTLASTPKKSSAMTKSIKSWTKELISDIGKPPTSKYDAAQAESSSSSPASYGTNTVGAPYWSDNRPGKM